MRTRQPLHRSWAALLVAGLVATGCSGGDDIDARTDEPSAEELSTTTTIAVPIAPLTGQPVGEGTQLHRPALVVKFDNVEPKARPQAGLNQADVVYEERVEGSVTRLLGVFHSNDVAPAGPVRSARTSDLGLLGPLNRPLFAWSGANPTFAARVRAADLVDVGVDQQPDQYFRDSGRRAPSNLMLKSTADLRNVPADQSGPPPALFTFRAPGATTANLTPVAGVSVSYGTSAGAAPVDYRWNGTGWERTQKGTAHVDASGVRVAPENVIVQFVDYADSGVADQFGTQIPEAQLVGSGDAWIFTSGGVIKGRWQKASLEAVTVYTDAAGTPIALTPGRTWVALPQRGGATTFN